jgi:uncharacterized protein (UPF0332 family)
MAHTHLMDARVIAALPLPHVAAREAYLAAYHAAEALIVERTGRPVKTHRGLRARFAELVRGEPGLDKGFVAFLARAYEMKSVADYGGGPGAQISTDDAAAAIALAERMIFAVQTILEAAAPE